MSSKAVKKKKSSKAAPAQDVAASVLPADVRQKLLVGLPSMKMDLFFRVKLVSMLAIAGMAGLGYLLDTYVFHSYPTALIVCLVLAFPLSKTILTTRMDAFMKNRFPKNSLNS